MLTETYKYKLYMNNLKELLVFKQYFLKINTEPLTNDFGSKNQIETKLQIDPSLHD